MTIAETIDKVLDIIAVPEAERDRFRKMMLMTATMVAIKTVPAPDDFTVGETEEELQNASETAAEILENNVEARAAIAEHFTGVLESMGGSLPEEKLEALKDVLEEFRA